MKKAFLGAAAALMLASAAFGQGATILPVQVPYNAWVDLGAGPIKVKVVGTDGVLLYAGAANCTSLGSPPSTQQGSMPLRFSDPAAVFWTTLHVCASALVSGTTVLPFSTTVVSP